MQIRVVRRVFLALCVLLWLPCALYAGTLAVKTGTYTGDGADNRTIAGVGFTPKVIFIMGDTGNGSPVVRMNTMAGDESVEIDAAGGGGVNIIQSIDSDGFTIGTASSVNENTVRYDWVALAGTALVTVSWSGDGVDTRDITTTGVNPTFVFIAPASGQNQPPTWRGASPAGDAAFHGNTAQAANLIQTLGTAKFTIGNDASVNNATGTPTYHAFAVEGGAAAYTTGTYAGNSTDNRNITTTGMNPILVFVKIDFAVNGTFRTDGMGGDKSKNFTPLAYAADEIQSLGTTQFQVGTASTVNLSGFNYYWWAFANEPTTARKRLWISE